MPFYVFHYEKRKFLENIIETFTIYYACASAIIIIILFFVDSYQFRSVFINRNEKKSENNDEFAE